MKGIWGRSQKEKTIEELKTEGSKIDLARYKGLGEMNPSQLRETTLSKKTRQLIQLTVTSKNKDTAVIDKLLSKKKILERKEWLESKGNLVQID